MKQQKKIGLYVWVVVILIAVIIDLISKHYTNGINQSFIPGFISFKYAQNTGAAFSLFSDGTTALIIISIIAIILISFYAFFSKTESVLFHVSLGLIVGGAFGNLFDRIVFGYVRDFIKLEFINFPIFNLADSFLTIGVICLCLFYLIEVVKEFKNKKKKNNLW